MPAVLHTTPYLKYIIYASLRQKSPKEDITYPVISEFLAEHKVPKDRFIIYPQIVLPWKPDQQKDNREEIPDFGVGNFSLDWPPHFRLRVGAEAKRAVDIMRDLPEPSTIEGNEDLMTAFHGLYFQGEDQAKSAIKGGYNLTSPIPFFLFVGPYWASVQYGPFRLAQLTVRTHKPSGSADYVEATLAENRLNSPPIQQHLYLLGTNASRTEMERVIGTTDAAAQPFINAARNFKG